MHADEIGMQGEKDPIQGDVELDQSAQRTSRLLFVLSGA
jgi:hypothetical protein